MNCTHCDRRAQSRNLCGTHYAALWKIENAERYSHECQHCGEAFKHWRKAASTCSPDCQRRRALETARPLANLNRARNPNPPKPPLKSATERAAIHASKRAPLRAAYEDAEWATFLTELRKQCDIDTAGCWNWTRQSKARYPIVKFGGRYQQVHRLALSAKHGAPLGSQPAHHICANTMCVNPDHLQPVTHRENTAEMLARNAYIQRIAELETALASIEPNHPVLDRIAYAV